MPLYPYQLAAVAALEDGATLLAAQPGAGKTAVAVEYARRTGAQVILVVCPAIAQGVWTAEVARWWPEARAVLLRDLVAGAELPDGPVFVITSFDYLTVNQAAQKWVWALDRFNLAMLDESHALKTPSSKRTRLLYGPRCAGAGLLSRCGRVILLSGTPAPNGLPSEIWPALRALAPTLIDNLGYEAFVARYCLTRPRPIKGGRTIAQIVGANPTTTADLARRLRPFWHRPPRADVERDLPPLRWALRHLPVESVDQTALSDLEDSAEAAELRAAVDAGDLRGVEGNVSRLRRLLATLKVQATASWVEQVLADGESKVLVWAWHVAALHDLEHRLRRHRSVLIEGATPAAARVAAIEAFQNGNARVFLGQIQAAGQAVTLTAGRRAVFLEQAFVPGLNVQAAKRMHRIGQRWPCLAEILVTPGLDESVNALLVRKAADIAALEGSAAA